MRSLLLLGAWALAGCATTVYRLEGEPITPAGPAKTACESAEWLVIAPTRAEVTEEHSGKSHPETGIGLYRVGEADPESIPSIERLPRSDMVDRKREALAPYQTRQIVAGVLGTAGVTAIAVGTILFVTAFESQGNDTSVNGGKAAAGGVVVGLGFALGISGLVVNPSHAERTEANATRNVFFSPPDDPKAVEDLVKRHNETIRSSCPDGAH